MSLGGVESMAVWMPHKAAVCSSNTPPTINIWFLVEEGDLSEFVVMAHANPTSQSASHGLRREIKNKQKVAYLRKIHQTEPRVSIKLAASETRNSIPKAFRFD